MPVTNVPCMVHELPCQLVHPGSFTYQRRRRKLDTDQCLGEGGREGWEVEKAAAESFFLGVCWKPDASGMAWFSGKSMLRVPKKGGLPSTSDVWTEEG